ncbi:MAG: chemotaxis protein CheR, partial [Treponema sp.]|nr:chemotaxis protein CheR [Treponema sp.]
MTLEELSLAAETRLGIKAGEGDLERFRAYLEKTYPRGGPEILDGVFGSGEAASFLTVNETYFFRESAHFHLLRKLLPDFYETLGLQGTLRICSAASSIGCEALSIAALIENHNRF